MLFWYFTLFPRYQNFQFYLISKTILFFIEMARMTHKQTSAEDEAEKQIQSIRNETKTDLKKGGKLNGKCL